MGRFVSAEGGEDHTVIYTDGNGRKYVFAGGTRSWRNNNPGNLVPGKISKRNGAIGRAGGFAVFPDPQAGMNAMLDSLRSTHGNKSLEQMIYAYAPPSENKTARYLRFLRRHTGVIDDRKIKDFTNEQFEKLWRAMMDMEGGIGKGMGTITEIGMEKRRITSVRKNKRGTITAYHIEGLGWVSKQRGIALTQQGRVDAVVAISTAGNQFLRSRPGSHIENLDDMG